MSRDRYCDEVMHILLDSSCSNKTEASENDRSEEKNDSPTTLLGDKNDSTSFNESDCHDLFFNESSSSLINSTSESEDNAVTTDIDVYARQTARIPLYEKSESTVLQTLAGYSSGSQSILLPASCPFGSFALERENISTAQ